MIPEFLRLPMSHLLELYSCRHKRFLIFNPNLNSTICDVEEERGMYAGRKGAIE